VVLTVTNTIQQASYEECFFMSANKKVLAKEIRKKKRNFTIVPNELWEADVSAAAKIVWVYLLSNADNFDPSTRLIAKRVGLTRKALERVMRELQDAGMIRHKAGARGDRNQHLYVLESMLRWESSPKNRALRRSARLEVVPGTAQSNAIMASRERQSDGSDPSRIQEDAYKTTQD
jgi:hypothetical protein